MRISINKIISIHIASLLLIPLFVLTPHIIKANNNSSCIKVAKNVLLSSNEGTLSVWVKPMYPISDKSNHSLISIPSTFCFDSLKVWDVYDKKWAGHRLFFDFGSVSLPFPGVDFLEPMAWSHLVVSWKSGPNGYVRSFLNGELIRHSVVQYRLPSINNDVVLGDCRDKRKNAVFDAVHIFEKALNSVDVAVLYKKEYLSGKYKINSQSPLKKEKFDLLRNGKGERVEARVLFDEKPNFIRNLDDVIAKLKRGHFNVYVPCIWYGGKARWNSSIEQIQLDYYNSSLRNGKDVFEELIEKAHAIGVEVHPWFCVAKRQDFSHPEFADMGTKEGMYNIHLPGYSGFITNLITEVVKEYNIDGINLDYIRSGSECTSDSCSKLYHQSTGGNFILDSKLRADNIKKWQASTLNELVQKISQSVKSLKPNLLISVDSSPVPPGLLNDEGRNHKIWVNNGWVDLVFYMTYEPRLPIHEIDTDRSVLSNPRSAYPLVGNYDVDEDNRYKPRNAEQLIRLIILSQHRWPGVAAIYLYQQLDDQQIQSLADGPFKQKAVPDWAKILKK